MDLLFYNIHMDIKISPPPPFFNDGWVELKEDMWWLVLIHWHLPYSDITKKVSKHGLSTFEEKYLILIKRKKSSKLIYKTKIHVFQNKNMSDLGPLMFMRASKRSFKLWLNGISRNWILSIETNRQATEFPSIFATSDYL